MAFAANPGFGFLFLPVLSGACVLVGVAPLFHHGLSDEEGLMARVIAEREDVLPGLTEVFRRYGFEGASLARISEATGLGKGSLYHFFPGGKDEMAEVVLGHVPDWFEVNIFRPLEDEAPVDGIARMFAGVDSYFRSGQRVCLVGTFALEETRDRFSEAIGGYFLRWIVALAGALRRAGDAEGAADRLAGDTVAGIQGAIVLARALREDGRFREVLDGLRARLPEGDDKAWRHWDCSL